MKKPKSIIWFERLVWISVAPSFFILIQWWPLIVADLNQFQNLSLRSPVIDQTVKIVGVVINLVLCVFVARRKAKLAKWIFVFLSILYFLANSFGIANGIVVISENYIGLARIFIQIIAVFLLFLPDSSAWLDSRDSNLTEKFN
jgi:hypothetical protein